MASVGAQAKYLLESTFDQVANKTITCVTSSGILINYKAIVHSEITRARREKLFSDNEDGLIDRNSKGVILLTRDIINSGISKIEPSWYFLIDDERYDFELSEPFCDDELTPFKDAENVFVVFYTRRAAELESQVSTAEESSFSFNSWGIAS